MEDDGQRATDARRIKRSALWKHFTELLGGDRATCKYCEANLSIKGGSIPNLKKHLKSQHPEAFDELLMSALNDETPAESNLKSPNEIDVATILRHSACTLNETGEKIYTNNINGFNRSTKRSAVWKHYTMSHKCPKRAMCDYCQSYISFTGGSTNLRKHLRLMHPEIYMGLDKADGENEELNNSTELDALRNNNSTELGKKSITKSKIMEDSSDDGISDFEFPPAAPQSRPKEKSDKVTSLSKPSVMWSHFTVSPKFPKKAKCDYCHSYISYTGGANNLRKHLRSKHTRIYNSIKNGTEPCESMGIEEVFIVPELEENDIAPEPQEDSLSNLTKSEKAEKNRRSAVWNHFTEVLPYRNKATCYHCKRDVSKKGGNVGNLRAHLKRRHPKEFKEILRDERSSANLPISDNEESEDNSDVDLSSVLDDGAVMLDSNSLAKRSVIWLHYTVSPKMPNRANCDYCRRYISFKGGTTSNLRKHLKAKHQQVYDEILKSGNFDDTDEGNDIMECVDDSLNDSSSPEKSKSITKTKTGEAAISSNKRSVVWKHFTRYSKLADRAKCNYCPQLMTFKGGSTTSLRKHLEAKHKTIDLVDKEISPLKLDEINGNETCDEVKDDSSLAAEPLDNNSDSDSDNVLSIKQANKKKKITDNTKSATPTKPGRPATPTKDDCNAVFIKFVVSELNVLKDPLLVLETKWKILELIQTARRQQLTDSKMNAASVTFPDTLPIEVNDSFVATYIISNTDAVPEQEI